MFTSLSGLARLVAVSTVVALTVGALTACDPSMFAGVDRGECLKQETTQEWVVVHESTPKVGFDGSVAMTVGNLGSGMESRFVTKTTCVQWEFPSGRPTPSPSPTKPR